MTAAAASLHELQRWFLAVVTHPGSTDEALSCPGDGVEPHRLEQLLTAGPRQTALERLQIYQHGYFARLLECLSDDFPAVQFALGADGFSELCRGYVTAYPAREPNLNTYGQHFSAFLRAQPGCSPFAAELAELEWALIDVLHAPSSGALSAAALQHVPPEQLPHVCFVANTAVRLLSFEYPVSAYLSAFFRAEAPTLPAPEASAVVVVRQDYTLRRIELTVAQAALLARLLSGEPLLAALTGSGVEAHEIQAWFRDWTAWGLFAALRTQP